MLGLFAFCFVCAGSSSLHTRALSSCRERGLLFTEVCGLLTRRLLLLRSTGCWSWCTGLLSPWHVGSSQTRDRTCIPCTGRQVLKHRTVREVQNMLSKKERRKERKERSTPSLTPGFLNTLELGLVFHLSVITSTSGSHRSLMKSPE